MVHYSHKEQEKTVKSIKCCAYFNPISITIIIILAVALGISGYFNYKWHKDNQSLSNNNESVNTNFQSVEDLTGGEIVSLENDQITVKDAADNLKTYNTDSKTVYKKSPSGGGNFLKAEKGEFVAGKQIIIILSTDRETAQELDLVS